MMRFCADIHTHSIASGHAYGTIREMAQAASEKHLPILGISEHAPGIPGTTDPFYYCNLKVVPRTLYGVTVVHGCEINVLNDGTRSLADSWMKYLDYAIVGIHRQCYRNQGRERNTDNLILCMRHEKVRLVSHPDDNHTPLNYPRLVRAAKKWNVALEVNNSSFTKQDERLGCLDNYRTMLALCEKHRVPVVVSSDAHDPSWVGRLDEAAAFLEEVHFDRSLILNLEENRERFIRFFHLCGICPRA
ncbi:MAG: phosphatase [Aristaeellaceae bacterium]